MTSVVTLEERQRLRLSAMRVAVATLDRSLMTFAREHGGRFIRFGSSATGHLRTRSDIDLIADFPDQQTAHEACRRAEDLCLDLDLVADIRPIAWVSGRVVARALAEGLVLR